MRIQQLRYLVAAADSSSYAQAAKRCFTSRQNVVHAIRELEEELGVVLFERRNNVLVATGVGDSVVRQAKIIIQDMDSLTVMFAEEAPAGELTSIAISTNLFAGIPAAANAYFGEHSAAFQFLELSCQECYEAVRTGRVDIALVMSMQRVFSDCSLVKVESSPTYVIMDRRHELVGRRGLEVKDLLDQKLMLMSAPPFQYMPLFEQLDTLGYNRADANVITSTASLVHMAREFGAVGIVSEKYAMDPPGDMVAIPIDDSRVNWFFYILYRRNAEKHRQVIRIVNDIQCAFGEDAERD